MGEGEVDVYLPLDGGAWQKHRCASDVNGMLKVVGVVLVSVSVCVAS